MHAVADAADRGRPGQAQRSPSRRTRRWRCPPWRSAPGCRPASRSPARGRPLVAGRSVGRARRKPQPPARGRRRTRRTRRRPGRQGPQAHHAVGQPVQRQRREGGRDRRRPGRSGSRANARRRHAVRGDRRAPRTASRAMPSKRKPAASAMRRRGQVGDRTVDPHAGHAQRERRSRRAGGCLGGVAVAAGVRGDPVPDVGIVAVGRRSAADPTSRPVARSTTAHPTPVPSARPSWPSMVTNSSAAAACRARAGRGRSCIDGSAHDREHPLGVVGPPASQVQPGAGQFQLVELRRRPRHQAPGRRRLPATGATGRARHATVARSPRAWSDRIAARTMAAWF